MLSNSISLGRVFGIELRLHYTWFLLFGLVLLSFTVGTIPQILPDVSTFQAFVLGLVLTLLFFGSVLIHELSHSLYAKRIGLKIERMTLFIFGGAAEIEEEPKAPGNEFMMAVLGPLSSFIIGLIFAAVWYFGWTVNNEIIAGIGIIMASINIVLAIFNLLPGYPLDGGRIFRSLVWKITGDFLKATKFAVTGGHLIAYLIIFYGLAQFLVGGMISGLWLVFIGLFLRRAASLSYHQSLAIQLLGNIKVKDIMSRNFTAVPRNMSVKDALKNFAIKKKQLVLPVKPGKNRPAGIVMLDRVDSDDVNSPVSDILINQNVSLKPEDKVIDAYRLINKQDVPNLPVVDGSQIVGIISLNRIKAFLLGKYHIQEVSK